jgi:hypothetical protein
MIFSCFFSRSLIKISASTSLNREKSRSFQMPVIPSRGAEIFLEPKSSRGTCERIRNVRLCLLGTQSDRASQVLGSNISPKFFSPTTRVIASRQGANAHVLAKSHGIGVISPSSIRSRFATSALGGKGSLGIQWNDFGWDIVTPISFIII